MNQKKLEVICKQFDIKRIENINKKFSILESKNKRYFMKLNVFPSKGTITHTLIGNIRIVLQNVYSTELNINQCLLRTSYQYFHFPKLVFYDNKETLLFEYIEDVKGLLHLVNDQTIVDSMIEFQFKTSKPEYRIKDKLINLLRSSNMSLLRILISTVKWENGNIVFLKSLIIFLRLINQQRPLGVSFLTHKDLRCNSNYIVYNNHFYLIDFASTILDNRWVLLDLVDLSWNPYDLTFNINLIKKYMENINKYVSVFKINIKAQIRFELMRKILFYINNSKTRNELKLALKKFYLEILVDDEKYNDWYLNL